MPRFSRYQKSSGAILGIVLVLLVVFIGILGVTLYVGLTAYVQNELQKLVDTTAQVGASSFYDGSSSGPPVKEPGRAQTAASETFDHFLQSSPALQSFNAHSTALDVDPAAETVRVRAEADIPSPFLAPVGVKSFTITASSAAKFVYLHLDDPVSVTPGAGNPYQLFPLPFPLIDGNGTDMIVRGKANAGTSGFHGYLVEACMEGGNTCYDLGGAAIPGSGNSTVVERDYGGQTRRVIYGMAYIDLAALGPGYNNDVKKATAIRIVDDGVHDQYIPAFNLRGIELVNQPTEVESLDILHFSVACSPDTMACALPANFRSGT